VIVNLVATEVYPVLLISDYDGDYDSGGGTEVPDGLLANVKEARAGVARAEAALLGWLHERQPQHPIFWNFPHIPPV